jgi:hypothetical protein
VRTTLIVTALLMLASPAAAQAPVSPAAQAPGVADLSTLIGQLASLDYPIRMNAARLVRRAPAAEAVPALTAAVKAHPDQFVRYRALIILTTFNDRGTGDLIKSLLTDRNDRLREVAYRWLELHPDPATRFALLSSLQTEAAEFVRPTLVAALAAMGSDAEVQRALVPEVTRGLDFFRSAAIDALGHHKAAYAFDAIAQVALLDGPLQNDAVLAIGRIGGPKARQALAAVTNATPDVRVTLRAAECLLGDNCDSIVKSLVETAASPTANADVARAAAAALSAIAAAGPDSASTALLALGGRGARARDLAAVGLATAALRAPTRHIAWLNTVSEADRGTALDLLKDGFDDLEEDFAEEQFFATARASYWSAPEASAARGLSATLIQRLEF